ncbi:DMT family transporter [Solihabitans fulvus]|uniref:DMT family transporter n=1 Tax=Solihabitans fulvus TaxID=1892852 RepID=A0A5B2WT87_9PSEU|nr:DMT family transporter [Solihabitans fulvus]KAA2253932.1 DMT family transporter [Solihabitans fulvus]
MTVSKKHALLLGFLGVLAFSMTLPATRLADPAFGGWTVAFGRAVVAAVLAGLVLLAKRQPLLPPKAELRPLLIVVIGVVVGFPLFTSLALETVGSSHGAVVTGLIPAATAGFAVLLAGERPRRSYWAALAIGLAGVLSLPIIQGHGRFELGDVLLVAAVVVAGLGYSQGGVLARKYGGWRVICWALVLALPATVPITVITVLARPPHDVTAKSLAGLGYLSVISMFLGFFAWYEGLARGGVARVGRLQLVQPILTLGWSVLLLGETLDLVTIIAAVVVLGAVAVGRNARVDPAAPAATVPAGERT